MDKILAEEAKERQREGKGPDGSGGGRRKNLAPPVGQPIGRGNRVDHQIAKDLNARAFRLDRGVAPVRPAPGCLCRDPPTGLPHGRPNRCPNFPIVRPPPLEGWLTVAVVRCGELGGNPDPRDQRVGLGPCMSHYEPGGRIAALRKDSPGTVDEWRGRTLNDGAAIDAPIEERAALAACSRPIGIAGR